MKIIENLKIRDKLLLLLFLLFLPLVYFVYNVVSREIAANQELKLVAQDLTEAELISAVVHQFQRERARIIAAAEGDSLMMIEARGQRNNTDAAKKDLEHFLAATNRSFHELSQLNELQQYRSQLDQDNINLPGFRAYSSNLLIQYLHRIDENATGVSNIQISRELLSFRHLVEAKLQLGRVRSQLMRVLKARALTNTEHADLTTLRELHSMALQNFSRYAAKDFRQQVQQLVASPDYVQGTALLNELEQNSKLEAHSYDYVKVFQLYSRIIEEINRIEGQMIKSIRQNVETESDSKSRDLSMFIGLLILSLILTILLSVYLISLISGSMATLRKAADRVRLGATDVVIDITSTDEIGEVAQSFKGVVQKNISLTRVVQAIGSGNYDVEVDVLSKEDLLSGAISEMRDNLRFYTRESANRSWVMSGITELNNLISNTNSLEQVTDRVISYLCSYTQSESGLLYLHQEGGLLQPVASHGISVGLEQLSSFRIGTGLVGQAVRENKVKVLEDIPHNYMMHTSGLATITPASIVILPLFFTEDRVGAIELSARHQYSELELEFLKNAAERISILIQNLTTHLRTQELLYETQNQAEELETQQEELRQLNAELKASEEELKVSQEELQEKNAELEEKAQLLEEQFEAVRNKNQALEDARQAIELKMEQVETVSKYKSDFLANMSHELRTPLNSILILSRLLADNTDHNLSEKQEEHARIIHRSGSDLLKLINEILDLSKIESGQLKLELENVNIKELAIQDIFKDLAVSKKIDFEVKLEQGLPNSFITDRFRLEQILKNFLSNAFKFTPEGGKVSLNIFPVKEGKTFQSEQLNQQQHILAFRVSDTGIGISTDKQGLVFEAFQQADTSTTRRFGGSGLGLTISRELAMLLGGEIELHSEEGKGSTFTLYVPAQVPATQQQQQLKAKPAQAENLQTKVTPVSQVFDSIKKEHNKDVSLLIIEDDRGFNGVLADFSLAKNFEVHQAYTGQEGLQLARKVKPDAILLDINLPDISGWEVLKQIRETKELRHVNVHVMSAYDREVVGKHHENEEYLPKPVTLEMLNKAFTTIGQASHRSIKKILIVEDNEIENKAIAELLLAHGLESISAYDATEAEQLLARQKIDCIILDINLPGIKGNEWMETIRARKGLADIPIIIYSGKDLSEAEEAALKQYANTVIIKNEYSYVRLLDEVQLFLHKVNQKLPTGKDFKMKLHVPEEILQNKKALVVDDDIRNVYSLHNLLELQGMNIVVAYDGKEALKKLETESNIDIVLMDVMMPEMDGIEAIQHIRNDQRHKHLPIIALTAKAMKGDKEKCLEAGASDYIPKPVDTEKLLTLMRVWLYEA